jgi:undecaprenyl-diphosphatase
LLSFLSPLKRYLAAHWGFILLLLFGVFLPLQIFGDLAEDVWEHGGFSFDLPILWAVHSTARPWLDQLAAFLTRFGVYWGVFPAAIAIGVRLLARRRWSDLEYFVITLIGSIVINRVTKVWLHRARPHLWTSPAPELDYGFPSGHAMASMTFVVVLVILTWETRWRWLVLVIGSLFVLAIAWTRLYLGVHFPSDILAGWTASLGWAIGVNMIRTHIRPHRG